MNKKRIKDFIIRNQMNLVIGVISIVAFIIGCFAIGTLKSLCIIGVIDILLFLPNLLEIYHKKKKGGTKMSKKKTKKQPERKTTNKKAVLEEKTIPIANKPVQTKTKKKPKEKKKGKFKRFLKLVLIYHWLPLP